DHEGDLPAPRLFHREGRALPGPDRRASETGSVSGSRVRRFACGGGGGGSATSRPALLDSRKPGASLGCHSPGGAAEIGGRRATGLEAKRSRLFVAVE